MLACNVEPNSAVSYSRRAAESQRLEWGGGGLEGRDQQLWVVWRGLRLHRMEDREVVAQDRGGREEVRQDPVLVGQSLQIKHDGIIAYWSIDM